MTRMTGMTRDEWDYWEGLERLGITGMTRDDWDD